MQSDFAILGAGAIGSILGAHLATAGYSVVMIAREPRARQIRADGLCITGLAERTVRVEVLTDPSQLASASTLIVATKTHGTAEALSSLRHVDLGTALSIQNGVLKNTLLADSFGAYRVLGAVADTSGEMLRDGSIRFTRSDGIMLGETTGDLSARAQHVARAIDASGVRATAVRHVDRLEWAKFVAWAGLMLVSVTTRVPTWQFLTAPGSARVLVRLMREMAGLASALNVELVDQSTLPVATLCRGIEEEAVAHLVRIGQVFQRTAVQHRMSSLQDLEAGRPLEIHETLGFALKKAAEVNVAMPLTEAFYHLASGIDHARSQCESLG